MKRLSRLSAQFFKFGLVGLSSTAVSYAVYSLLVYTGRHYIFAGAASFFIGVLNSFFWNNKYVFKRGGGKRNTYHALVKTYASYAFTGLVLHNALLYVMIGMLRVSKYTAPLFSLLFTVPINYILNRQWAFKPDCPLDADTGDRKGRPYEIN